MPPVQEKKSHRSCLKTVEKRLRWGGGGGLFGFFFLLRGLQTFSKSAALLLPVSHVLEKFGSAIH